MSTAEGDEQDLTRKQRREQARAKRRELEQAELARAARRTRLIQLGVVAAVVLAIIIGIVVATGSGGSKKGLAKAQEVPQVVNEVNGQIAGIPQSGNTIGSPNAPVTLQYFGDLECPVCREFTLGALPTLIQNYVRAGKLKIEYRSLESATREQETFRTQQIAALAAGKQQKLWDYIELFYRQQGEESSGYVTESYLQKLAQQVPGLNLSKWATDRSDAALASSITSDEQAANNGGLNGTPSFMIAKAGGTPQKFEPSSFKDPSSYAAAVESLLKR